MGNGVFINPEISHMIDERLSTPICIQRMQFIDYIPFCRDGFLERLKDEIAGQTLLAE